MTRTRTLLMAMAVVVVMAQTAWAAVLQITVTDSAGQPVAGGTVVIEPEGKGQKQELPVNGGGTLTVELPEGMYKVTARHPDGSASKRIEAGPGSKPQIVELQLPTPIGANAGKACGSCFTLGVGAGYSLGQDGHLTSQSISNQVVVNNRPVLDERNETSAAEINEINRTAEKNLTLTTFPVMISVGGAGIGGTALALRRSGHEWSTERGALGREQAGQSAARGGWRFYPTLSAGGGRASVEFESRELEHPEDSDTFSGDGIAYGGGVSALLVPSSSRGWYFGVGYSHLRTPDIDMTRSPALQSREEPGVVITQDRANYTYRSHVIDASVGYAFRHFAPFAGIRRTIRRASLVGDMGFDLSGVLRVPATQTVHFENRFELEVTEAAAGIDIRIPRTSVFLSLQGSTDGNSSAFSTNLVFGLGIR